MDRPERWRALLVSAVVVTAVGVPGVRMVASDEAPDGFPLSTYPMFTSDRGRVVELPTVVAVRPDGTTERLSPATIAGTDQVVQAGVTVRQAVAAGTGATARLCAEVAGRVDGAATVAVVVERHDVVTWSAGARDPVERRVLAECETDDAVTDDGGSDDGSESGGSESGGSESGGSESSGGETDDAGTDDAVTDGGGSDRGGADDGGSDDRSEGGGETDDAGTDGTGTDGGGSDGGGADDGARGSGT